MDSEGLRLAALAWLCLEGAVDDMRASGKTMVARISRLYSTTEYNCRALECWIDCHSCECSSWVCWHAGRTDQRRWAAKTEFNERVSPSFPAASTGLDTLHRPSQEVLFRPCNWHAQFPREPINFHTARPSPPSQGGSSSGQPYSIHPDWVSYTTSPSPSRQSNPSGMCRCSLYDSTTSYATHRRGFFPIYLYVMAEVARIIDLIIRPRGLPKVIPRPSLEIGHKGHTNLSSKGLGMIPPVCILSISTESKPRSHSQSQNHPPQQHTQNKGTPR